MFECCILCYEKYLNDKGEIIPDKLEKAIKQYEEWSKEKVDRDVFQVCTCDCHKENSVILH